MTNFFELEGAQLLRQAWIDGLKNHYAGEVKPSWIAAWDALPDWQQMMYCAVYSEIARFLAAGQDPRLTRGQKSQITRLAWVCAYWELHRGEVEEKHTRNWQALGTWEQEVDADLFIAVEQAQARLLQWEKGTG